MRYLNVQFKHVRQNFPIILFLIYFHFHIPLVLTTVWQTVACFQQDTDQFTVDMLTENTVKHWRG